MQRATHASAGNVERAWPAARPAGWTIARFLRRTFVVLLSVSVAVTMGSLGPAWAAGLLVICMAVFVAPGLALAWQIYSGQRGAIGCILLAGPAWGFGIGSLALLAAWVVGARHPLILAVAPLAAVALLCLFRPLRLVLRSPNFTRRDLGPVLAVLLMVPLVVGLPYARVGTEVPEGRAYRAYFTADFVWAMAVVAEVAKGDVPPRNQFVTDQALHYYWLPFLLSAAEYRHLQGAVSLEQVLLTNGVLCGLFFLAFLYFFTRHFTSRPGAAAIGCVAVVLFTSFEGLERLIVVWREGLPLDVLRTLNIDAVTRWFYGALPADGLHRVLLYQPQHHAMGYMAGLSGVLIFTAAREPWRVRAGALAGLFLALNVLLSAFSAILLTLATALVALGRLIVRHRWRGLLTSGVAGALPLIGALAISRGLAYVDPSRSAFQLVDLIDPATLGRPLLALFLNFGPVALAATAGVVLALRRGTGALAVPLTLILVALVFFYVVDVQDHEHVYVAWRAGHLLFIAFAPLIAFAVQEIRRRGVRVRVAATAGGVLLALAAAPTTVIDLYNTQDIANRRMGPGFPWTLVLSHGELEGLAWIKEWTRPDAVVQVEPFVRDPATWSYIPAFAERRMAGGLPISMVPADRYNLPAQRMRRVYRARIAEEAYDIAERNGVQYLIVGPPERETYPAFEEMLDGRRDLFWRWFSNGTISIYQIAHEIDGH
jgi:hypothetical protein